MLFGIDTSEHFEIASPLTLNDFAWKELGACSDDILCPSRQRIASTARARAALSTILVSWMKRHIKELQAHTMSGELLLAVSDKGMHLVKEADDVRRILNLLGSPQDQAGQWCVKECEEGTPAWRFANARNAILHPNISCGIPRGLYRHPEVSAVQRGEIVLTYRGLACTDEDILAYDKSMPSVDASSPNVVDIAIKDSIFTLSVCKADDRDPLLYAVYANDGRSLKRAVGPSLERKVATVENMIRRSEPNGPPTLYTRPSWVDAKEEAPDIDRENNLEFRPHIYLRVNEALTLEHFELFQVGRALKIIKPGAEVLWDYGDDYWRAQGTSMEFALETALKDHRIAKWKQVAQATKATAESAKEQLAKKIEDLANCKRRLDSCEHQLTEAGTEKKRLRHCIGIWSEKAFQALTHLYNDKVVEAVADLLHDIATADPEKRFSTLAAMRQNCQTQAARQHLPLPPGGDGDVGASMCDEATSTHARPALLQQGSYPCETAGPASSAPNRRQQSASICIKMEREVIVIDD